MFIHETFGRVIRQIFLLHIYIQREREREREKSEGQDVLINDDDLEASYYFIHPLIALMCLYAI